MYTIAKMLKQAGTAEKQLPKARKIKQFVSLASCEINKYFTRSTNRIIISDYGIRI
jgi:hypothetical protein